MVPNTNDGSQNPPRLRIDLNLGVLHDLPPWSKAPCGECPEMYSHARSAGYDGFQGGDAAACRAAGLGATAMGRVNKPGEAYEIACNLRDAGFDAITLHVGTELESDDDTFRVAEDIILASARAGFPMYIETHRATITQDMWRTIQLARRLPEIRFNADYSHWYTGHEMVYGDLEWKWLLLEVVFERTRFMHGRIGNSGSMQVDVGDGKSGANVGHFREMWTRSMMGFLRTAKPGDYLVFAPEVLKSEINYARIFPGPDGKPREETDRWEQSFVLRRIAQECFAEARSRLERKS